MTLVILHPTRRALGTSGALLTLPGIWACALLLAMPQFLFRTLQHHDIGLPGLDAVNFCFEEWPVDHGRGYYSVFVMLVQFFVPLLTVTISYARIVHKLKFRMTKTVVRNADFSNPFGDDTDAMLMVYAICHLLGMSSACSNPVLYGWLNDNFRKEFNEFVVVGMKLLLNLCILLLQEW
ncbi:hypothetical protein HAZT_HAZT006706 [Hyalella azteca]|uniref:G-protein coupled receptors family 1 profile domain-containing protein n=1 Tax=Hyalella azteca TaxID=294128 RepID=A0A6A0H7U5_HYAAZ|nr:hypothetical protein HAZT_HAZT006706 [Hyalella azteca]